MSRPRSRRRSARAHTRATRSRTWAGTFRRRPGPDTRPHSPHKPALHIRRDKRSGPRHSRRCRSPACTRDQRSHTWAGTCRLRPGPGGSERSRHTAPRNNPRRRRTSPLRSCHRIGRARRRGRRRRSSQGRSRPHQGPESRKRSDRRAPLRSPARRRTPLAHWRRRSFLECSRGPPSRNRPRTFRPDRDPGSPLRIRRSALRRNPLRRHRPTHRSRHRSVREGRSARPSCSRAGSRRLRHGPGTPRRTRHNQRPSSPGRIRSVDSPSCPRSGHGRRRTSGCTACRGHTPLSRSSGSRGRTRRSASRSSRARNGTRNRRGSPHTYRGPLRRDPARRDHRHTDRCLQAAR